MKAKTKQLPISDIKIPPEAYPRVQVDWRQVERYGDALDAGAEFPPIAVAIERGQAYVIDGQHRMRAFAARGKQTIECDIIDDLPRKRWLLEAASRNDRHGNPLSYQDKLRTIVRLRQAGIGDRDICAGLNLVRDTMAAMLERRVVTQEEGGAVALKPALAEVASKTTHLSASELERLQRAFSGQKQLAMLLQVVELLERHLIRDGDERILEALDRLHELTASYARNPERVS